MVGISSVFLSIVRYLFGHFGTSERANNSSIRRYAGKKKPKGSAPLPGLWTRMPSILCLDFSGIGGTQDNGV
jgi:hypothetical protein